jgi:hypothetical protein
MGEEAPTKVNLVGCCFQDSAHQVVALDLNDDPNNRERRQANQGHGKQHPEALGLEWVRGHGKQRPGNEPPVYSTCQEHAEQLQKHLKTRTFRFTSVPPSTPN